MQPSNGNTTKVERKALTEEQVNRFWIDGYLDVCFARPVLRMRV